MDNPLKNLIEIIKTGSREEVKAAQKQVEKYWHEVYIPKRKEGKEAFEIFLDEIGKFDEIKDVDHQAYFINTLKWPLWAVGEEYFEKWAEFILKYIQHPSGKIRQAIIHAADYLILDIAVDLKFDFGNKISEENKKMVENNINRFGNFVYSAEYVLSRYDDPSLHKFKYVSDLPAGIYKSLQKLITDCLLRSDYYKNLYEKWLKDRNTNDEVLSDKNFEQSEAGRTSRDADSATKKMSEAKTIESVEKNLQNLLDKYELSGKMTVALIKNWALNDEGETTMDAVNFFQKKWLKYFARIKDINELNDILRVFTDAWNYFPHKSLKGKSPDEMAKEALKNNSSLERKDNQKMPDVIVGVEKITWNEYWKMIKEMEQMQIPFKDWIKNDLLPKYKKFLEQKFGKQTVDKHYEVADIFFERVLHVGFINFDQIRADFIQKEFPRWWQSHAMMSSLSEQEVVSSLKNLFEFIDLVNKKGIRKFGF